MKKLFTNLAVLLFIPALYFVFISAFTKPENTKNVNTGNESTVSNTVSTDTTKFINMIMNLDHSCGDSLWVKENVDRYKDSLGFNSVHVYPADDSLYGIFPFTLSSKQRGNIVSLINKVQNKNLKFFYEHAFFSWLCFAQRLVYEVPTVNGNTNANNGFCYKNVTVAPSSDSGRTVLHSVPGSNHDTVLLCSGIYENLQHSDKLSRQQDYSQWYLKPMVRAKLNGVQRTTPIFKIDIYSFDNTKIDERIIYAYNFEPSLNNYDSSYIDGFYDLNHNLMNISIIGDTLTGLNKGKNRDALINCKVDFKIYTYGYVDFWFDKLTVDDEYAHGLFNNLYEDRITELLDAVSTETNVYSLYMDELTYSQLPCTKYVMNKIDAYNQSHGKDIKFMVSESNWMNFNHMRNHALEHKPMLTLLQPRALNLFSYEFYHGDDNDVSSYVPSFAFDSVNFRIPNGWKTNNYNTYNNALQNNIFGHKNAASGGGIHDWGTFIYQVDLAKRNIVECSPNTLLYLNPQEYGEMWINEGERTFRGIIEPTNEEGGAQLMLSLAHGAQGLMWYIYQTKHYGHTDTYIKKNFNLQSNDNVSEYFILGLYGENDYAEKRRIRNIYGQNKWEYYKKLNQKINNWIPTLDKIKWDNGFSVHQDGVENYYIKDIKSIFRDYTGVFSDGPSCPNCDNVKYWEEGFFSPTDNNDLSKYFLMINRRCVPEVAGRNAGDIRQLKIKFKASELAGFNNWKLINVEDGSTITTFNKNSQDYVDAGEFQPGEGKLYKIAPVMQEGGTFVCDEVVNNLSFNCKGTVYTGGYSLSVDNNTTIEFNTDCRIVAENCLNLSFGGSSKLKGKNGAKWTGIYATNVENVFFDTVEISNIHNGWAVTSTNCLWNVFVKCQFNLQDVEGADNLGAVVINNTRRTSPQSYFLSNTVLTKNSTAAIAIINSATGLGSGCLEGNIILNNYHGATGVLVSNSALTTIGNNVISGFDIGFNFMNSEAELLNNTITANKSGAIGISGSSLSRMFMNSLVYMILGGSNKITNLNSNCTNVKINNSYFLSDQGYNEFNVSAEEGNYNFFGHGDFPSFLNLQATKNCFNGLNGTARYDLLTENGLPYVLTEVPHFCSKNEQTSVDFVLPLVEGITDTIYKSLDSIMLNVPYRMLLYKLMCKNVLQRNYDSASIKGYDLLTNYADSIFASDVISKLYLSVASIDSVGLKIQPLKTFYEQLIINHPQNISLVKSANYEIQKCKVYLKQYESALAGFEDIIAQNPYSFEGLLASWDYASTLLLIDTTNGAGGMSNKALMSNYSSIASTSEFLIDSLRSNRLSKYDSYDNSKFTQDDRQILIKVTGNVLTEERKKQVDKVSELEKQAKTEKNKDVSKSKKELESMRTLNEVVKTKRAKDQPDYIAIVSEDIKKVFKNTYSKDIPLTESIPMSYALYQNYPNPFNPTTKIAYDIPRDAKVKLIIYDILGREVKTLVNNEFKTAGKYITEFNGSYLSSGIYFARILVNEGKDFNAVKKLVLLK